MRKNYYLKFNQVGIIFLMIAFLTGANVWAEGISAAPAASIGSDALGSLFGAHLHPQGWPPKKLRDFRFSAATVEFGAIMGSVEATAPLSSFNFTSRGVALGYTYGTPALRMPFKIGWFSPVNQQSKTTNTFRVEGGVEIPFFRKNQVNLQKFNLYGMAKLAFVRYTVRGVLSGEVEPSVLAAGKEPLIGHSNSLGLVFGGGVEYLVNASLTNTLHLFLESGVGVISHEQSGVEVLQGANFQENASIRFGFRLGNITWKR